MKIKRYIRKLHRWIGLIASLWILLLASTGLLLQNSEQWQLDSRFISNGFLLSIYNIGSQFIAFEHSGHSLHQIDQQLIEDGIITIKLDEEINNAIFHQSHWIVTTDSSIYWINLSGQIAQSIDELDGLPLPIDNIGLYNETVIISHNNHSFDINTLQQISHKVKTLWSQPIFNNQLKKTAIELTSKNYLSYEQFIFDLHAGITVPKNFANITAIALIILSISGIFLFFRKNNRTNRYKN